MIQRDEETAQAKLFYAKLPDDIQSRYCLLLDPMLGEFGPVGCHCEGRTARPAQPVLSVRFDAEN